jgi:hypothetical protein
MIGSNHLTEETTEQGITFPGQAHFAIPGATRVCRECLYWSPRYQDDTRAICRKAATLTYRTQTQRVPGYAKICKHFEERSI